MGAWTMKYGNTLPHVIHKHSCEYLRMFGKKAKTIGSNASSKSRGDLGVNI